MALSKSIMRLSSIPANRNSPSIQGLMMLTELDVGINSSDWRREHVLYTTKHCQVEQPRSIVSNSETSRWHYRYLQ